LIDDAGQARLCDFGLASFTATIEMSTSAGWTRGTTSWMAPELYDLQEEDHEYAKPSQASDIYAMAMVIVEVVYTKFEVGLSSYLFL
jgi:serine/threonine protein kinase